MRRRLPVLAAAVLAASHPSLAWAGGAAGAPVAAASTQPPTSASPAASSGAAETTEDAPRLTFGDRVARGEALYKAARIPACVRHFEGLIGADGRRSGGDAFEQERARKYFAACLLASQQKGRARKVLVALVEEKPGVQPPNELLFQRDLIELFEEVLDERRKALKRRREEELEVAGERAERVRRARSQSRARRRRLLELASRETLVQDNSRALALVPFGVGQFQNRSSALGWVFLVSELAAGGTALGGLLAYATVAATVTNVDSADYRSTVNQTRDVTHVAGITFLGLVALGIGEAQLFFVPSHRSVRRRDIDQDLVDELFPPEPGKSRGPQGAVVAPAITPRHGGFSVDLVGRF